MKGALPTELEHLLSWQTPAAMALCLSGDDFARDDCPAMPNDDDDALLMPSSLCFA